MEDSKALREMKEKSKNMCMRDLSPKHSFSPRKSQRKTMTAFSVTPSSPLKRQHIGSGTLKKKYTFKIPTSEETDATLKGVSLKTSFGAMPNYWDRYHNYHNIQKKFRESPSLTSCLE
eukprot:PhF_6_TR13895/c0_g1_i1/m.22328